MTTDVERGGLDLSAAAHEPSYYEIALTNRQVVVAFVVLLVCLIAAFFSGVWIGRESSLRGQQAGQSAALSPAGPGASGAPGGGSAAAAAAAPDADKGDKGGGDAKGGEALQEFKFFSEPGKKPGRAEPAERAESSVADRGGDRGADRSGDRSTDRTAERSPGGTEPGAGSNRADRTRRDQPRDQPEKAPARESRSSTLADDLRGGAAARTDSRPNGARVAVPPSPQAPSAAVPAAGSKSGTAEREKRAAAPAASGARGTPAAAAADETSGGAAGSSAAPEVVHARPLPEAAASSSTAAVPPARSAAAGDLVIQVFSSADKAQAEKVRDRLQQAGQSAYLSPIEKGDHVMYRVRVGPFASREAAQRVAEQLRREQHLDTWVTPK